MIYQLTDGIEWR